MSYGMLEWIGIVRVLDTLGLVALRRTLVYDYSEFSILLHPRLKGIFLYMNLGLC